VHGILVQRPLPPQIDPAEVIAAIDPANAGDGFHPLNVGRIAIGVHGLATASYPPRGRRWTAGRPFRRLWCRALPATAEKTVPQKSSLGSRDDEIADTAPWARTRFVLTNAYTTEYASLGWKPWNFLALTGTEATE